MLLLKKKKKWELTHNLNLSWQRYDMLIIAYLTPKINHYATSAAWLPRPKTLSWNKQKGSYNGNYAADSWTSRSKAWRRIHQSSSLSCFSYYCFHSSAWRADSLLCCRATTVPGFPLGSGVECFRACCYVHSSVKIPVKTLLAVWTVDRAFLRIMGE